MEDFEYSVEICDRDWDCFFAECEECNLLPPTLAGVDDSGMSDSDTGSILAKRKFDLTASFSEADGSIDSPPDCEGSPVDRYLSKRGIGGMESILSGSEEDIHLQSVNMFFETMKSLTEAAKGVEQSQVKGGKSRDAKQLEQELCSGGKRASSQCLPKSISRMNSVPIRMETACDKESAEPVDTVSNRNTGEKPQPESNICLEAAASSLQPHLFVREEVCRETGVNDVTPQHPSESPSSVVGSEATSYSDDLRKTETSLVDVNQQDLRQSTHTESLETARWKQDQNLDSSRFDATNKLMSQESSPSASVKRKRRKKRRLSFEPAEEQPTWRGALSSPEEFFYKPQTHGITSATERKVDLPLSIPSHGNPDDWSPGSRERVAQEAESSTEKNSTNEKIPGQSGDGSRSELRNSADVSTSLKRCNQLQFDHRSETAGCLSERTSDQNTKNADAGNQSLRGCSDQLSLNAHPDKSEPVLLSVDSSDPTVEVGQSGTQSAAKTVRAEEGGNPGADKHTLCQKAAEAPQQLEVGCHSADRSSFTLESSRPPPAELHRTDVLPPDMEPQRFHTTATTSGAHGTGSERISEDFLSQRPSGQETGRPSGDKHQTANEQREMLCTDPSGPKDVTSESSSFSRDTGSAKTLSNDKIPDVSGSAVCQSDSICQGQHTTLTLTAHEASGSESKHPAGVSEVTASAAACRSLKAPDSKHSAFAMSSFWNEMEKLTINDILGLRMMRKGDGPSPPSPSQECETDMAYSSCFPQEEESKPVQSCEDIVIHSESAESHTNAVLDVGGVTWECEPCPLGARYDISQTMRSATVRDSCKSLRRISKNISVKNLRALESESLRYAWKGQTLQTIEEGEKVEGHKEVKAMEPADSSRISLTDLFQHLFKGKQSSSSRTATHDTADVGAEGTSVPEMYDHFFSEFDTDSFFYPLIPVNPDRELPVGSSTSTHLQFPEAYDHFFAISSSDDSSDEDEEETRGPLRVVTRFSQRENAVSTDIYDNFFTDNDVRQNFFWKTTLSFRNISFSASTVDKRRLSPDRKSGRSCQRAICPLSTSANPNVMLPDARFHHLEERNARPERLQLPSYQDVHMADSNPSKSCGLLSTVGKMVLLSRCSRKEGFTKIKAIFFSL